MLVSTKQLVERAQKDGYIVGAFHTLNLETTLGIIRAAVDAHSPAIIQISEATIQYAGLKPMTHIVETIAKNAAVDVPIALSLDRGKEFWSIAECIHAGFTSIMIAASDLPFDENLALTKQVTTYAHERNVWAHGELGMRGEVVPLLHEEEYYTDPAQARKFVHETGIDLFSVVVAGVQKTKKHDGFIIDEQRLREIHNALPTTPLFVRGMPHITPSNCAFLRKYGVLVIGVDVELREAFTATLRHTLTEHPEFLDLRDALEPSIEAVRQCVAEKLHLFNAIGKS